MVKKAIPISSTFWGSCSVVGPNKKKLALIDHKALYLDKEHGYFNKDDPPAVKIFNYEWPVLLHPEKDWFIAQNKNEITLFIGEQETKTWYQKALPLLKKPIIFGSGSIILLKQLLPCKSIQHPSAELEHYELYDLQSEEVRDVLDASSFINAIPEEVRETCVRNSFFARSSPTSIESFLAKPEYEISKFKAHYFSEYKNFFIFSFNLNCKNKHVHYSEKTAHFMLYDIEQKKLLYFGNAQKPILTCDTTRETKQHVTRIGIDSLIGKVSSFEFDTDRSIHTNHLYLETVHPSSIIEQLIALELIHKTWQWLQQENPDKNNGEQILKTLRKEELVPNPYKLIWQTTTPEYGNIFKKIYEKIKQLK